MAHNEWLSVPKHIATAVGDPTRAWEMLAPSRQHVVLPLSQFTEVDAQPPGTVRFVCVSDTHGVQPLPSIPDGDVLLHAGDWSSNGSLKEVAEFCEWLKALPHHHKIVIAGNHDLTMDSASLPSTASRFGLVKQQGAKDGDLDSMSAAAIEMIQSSCEYLFDSGTTVHGINIWGSPWQPWFCDWAFNLERGKPCREKWAVIPKNTDILITHGPPLGYGDKCFAGHRAGCLDLLDEVQTRIKPALHVYGHIHEDYGVCTDGTTTYANASTCNLNYQAAHLPLVFDLPRKDVGGGSIDGTE